MRVIAVNHTLTHKLFGHSQFANRCSSGLSHDHTESHVLHVDSVIRCSARHCCGWTIPVAQLVRALNKDRYRNKDTHAKAEPPLSGFSYWHEQSPLAVTSQMHTRSAFLLAWSISSVVERNPDTVEALVQFQDGLPCSEARRRE